MAYQRNLEDVIARAIARRRAPPRPKSVPPQIRYVDRPVENVFHASKSERRRSFWKGVVLGIGGIALLAEALIGGYAVWKKANEHPYDSVLTYDLSWSDGNDTIRPYALVPSDLPQNITIDHVDYADRTNLITAYYFPQGGGNLTFSTSNVDEQTMDNIINKIKGSNYGYFLDSDAVQELDSRGDLKSLAALVIGTGVPFQTETAPIQIPTSTIESLYNAFRNATYISFFSPNKNFDHDFEIGTQSGTLKLHVSNGSQLFYAVPQLLGDR